MAFLQRCEVLSPFAGQRLIVMEDVYANVLQKYLTYFVDSLANMGFKGHPHTNRSDAEWRQAFEKNGLGIGGAER